MPSALLKRATCLDLAGNRWNLTAMSDDLPESPYDRAEMLQNILLAACEGKASGSESAYREIRLHFNADPTTAALLPQFVRTCRDPDHFWAYIKDYSGQWAPRRLHIRETMQPLLDHLEGKNSAPGDMVASDALRTFDPDGVHSVWTKALERRLTDPEGAITVARTLLETICKRVLDETQIQYDEKDDLPQLYKKVAAQLNIAPSQHAEEAFRMILGGASSVVTGLGTLRNKMSDAHGRGGKVPVRPSQRHAKLAVNMAGAMATFIVETFLEKPGSSGD